MKCLLSIILFFALPACVIAQYSHDDSYQNPAVQEYERQLNESIQKELRKIDWAHAAKASQADTPLYIIPVVVHVVHDWGMELIADTLVFSAIRQLNNYYSKNIADTALIIDKFKPIAANTRIAFRSATIDPDGNPTKGVEHIRSYLTNNAYNQSKLDQWPPDKYLNIWLVRSLLYPNAVGGYSNYPVVAQTLPYYDGVLIEYDYILYHASSVHLTGQYLGLKYPCGYLSSCDDGDGIFDTPPCCSMNSCNNLYDTLCDTPNIQNVIGGESCGIMFTNGQAAAMAAVLNQNIANRSSLVTAANRAATGVDQAMPDLPPVAEFSVERGMIHYPALITTPERSYYACVGEADFRFQFANRSWNDTISGVQWHFSNGALTTDTTLAPNVYVKNQFTQPGWVTVSLTATGNNTGSSTITDEMAVYAADGNNPIVENPAALPMHFMEFHHSQTDNWPIFNYYKNSFKWQLNNSTGYYDNSSIEYLGFDTRQFPANTTGCPKGDYDDFFSPAYDLSAMAAGYCNLNFMSTGASRTGTTTDTLEISYSKDCGRTWTGLQKYTATDLDNIASSPMAYIPTGISDWKLNSIELPAAARTSKTFFRFRYKPGADANGYSTGNNFYLDRISISNFPTGINTLLNDGNDVVIAPNPASGDSYILLSSITGGSARITISNVSGGLVYSKEEKLQGSLSRLDIPSAQFPAGVYFVTINYRNGLVTRKLVTCGK